MAYKPTKRVAAGDRSMMYWSCGDHSDTYNHGDVFLYSGKPKCCSICGKQMQVERVEHAACTIKLSRRSK